MRQWLQWRVPIFGCPCDQRTLSDIITLSPILWSKQGSEMKSFYVYIMASRRNGTLYAGSTSDLIKRVWEHKNNMIPGFTAKYSVHIPNANQFSVSTHQGSGNF